MGFNELSGLATEQPETLHNRYRDQFPVTERYVYLNHASIAPLCRPAAEAMHGLIDQAARSGSLHYDRWLEAYSGLRAAAARMIHASPEEIAIVKNTSEGIATVALGLEWKPGDRVIVFREEFPANLYPWQRLERQGVEVVWFSLSDPVEQVAEAVPGAKLLAISFVNYLSGYCADLDMLGALCHASGCFFFVDAIQGMGALPIDVETSRIDALAADGHKWMLGPEGNGILYVRRKWLDAIEPAEFGWTNPANYYDYGSRDMTLRPDAGRYECGTLNTAGCFGHRAALEFLLEIGVENIAAAVLALASQVRRGASAKGYELLTAGDPRVASGIVSFRHPVLETRQIVSDLKRAGVLATARQGWIRVSPHFYISPGEIDHLLELLPPV